MNEKIFQILLNFVTTDQTLIHNIYSKLQHKKSKIIEIVGEPDSGKSLIFRQLLNHFTTENESVEYYIPQIFRYNRFKEILQLTTEISNEDFDSIISEAEKIGIKQKYDLFYFITEKMSERNLLKPKTIILYETLDLDQYTLDFIQYLVQYSEDVPIQFVLFTHKETFTFSEKFIIPKPSLENLQEMLSNLFPGSKNDYYSESEILEKITKGNVGTIGYVLLKSIAKDKKKINFSAFLDKKLSIKNIVNNKINSFNEKQKTLYFTILLLDTFASESNLKKIYGQIAYVKDLKFLEKQGILYVLNDIYHSKKTIFGNDFFYKLSTKRKDEIFQNVTKVLNSSHLDELATSIKRYDHDTILRIVNRISKFFDYDANIKLYKLLLEVQTTPQEQVEAYKNLGKSYRNLGKYDNASEYYRLALRISVENKLPLDDIVMDLAKSFHDVGSSSFAMEILKKYSPAPQNEFMQCKILILKTDILLEIEKYEEAIENVEQAFHLADKIKDPSLRYQIKADYYKILGKIHYYSNEWMKAQHEFEEAEKIYNKNDDKEGLAAIYNNLGVLAMYRGETKVAETLYLKSLKHEQSRYNLSGISFSYSNLGSLFEEKSDYKKSMQYFHEALHIQKLLGDRYNITNTYLNIGVTYMDNNKFKKAEEAFNNSLEIAMEFNLHKNVIACYNNLGALFFRSGDFSKAIDYYERAIKKSKDHGISDGMFQSYNNIGELFEKRGEYNIALDYYNKAKELLPNISDDFMKAELYGNLGSVLTQLHKFKDAYGYIVESFDFFKSLNAKDKIIEGSQKHAIYFILTRNYESANYYLEQALKLSEELENEFQIGKCYYIKAILEKDDADSALESLKIAIEKFVKTNNDFELALANFEYASLLLIKKDWEQALQILTQNKKVIESFEAIKFLERNDLLIQKINKKYEKEVKESKLQESILNKFYEITQQLNDISDFDTLLETAIDKFVDFADADGGIFALYNNQRVKDSWEYLILNNFSNRHPDFSKMMNIVQETYNEGDSKNCKQPHFAPEYNNIISYPLIVRNEKKGVICLFTKRGSHYFTEKMYNLISALCNQIVVIVENISYENLQKAHDVIREELATASTFTNIIGKSEKIQNIFRMIEKIKNAPTTILLEGPSGTGKELIARAIHYNSNRRNKQFVAQYCGALPETLLESELFGHVKGSFTGASHDKKGLFEIADGGTFFLDEIADISLSTQAKLLRFLQEGEIKRVGSINTQIVDVRVICATNVSLQKKVEKGEFRLDLFYRLNVIRLEIPSLKERKSDIPLLAVHFLDKYCNKLDKEVNGISEEAMKYLMNYDWPGNIRQLENELERAITLADGNTAIKSSDLSAEIFRFQDNQETVHLLEKRNLKDAVEDLEKQMILNILKETDWNQTQAAKKLGLSRQGLIKKMQRYQLVR